MDYTWKNSMPFPIYIDRNLGNICKKGLNRVDYCWKEYKVGSGQFNDRGPLSRYSAFNVLAWRVRKGSKILFVWLAENGPKWSWNDRTILHYIKGMQKCREIGMLEGICFVSPVYSTAMFQRTHFLTWLWEINLQGGGTGVLDLFWLLVSADH